MTVRRPSPSPHYSRNLSRWQEPLSVAVILAALTICAFWPQIAQKKALYFGDIGLYFTPQIAFARATILTGRLPLWNPLILCGTPFVGNPQSWLLYPFSAFLGIWDAPQFLSATIIFHVFWAASGMYWLLRKGENVSMTAAMFGAVVFGFGGQLVSKEQFPNMVQAAAWLPWILMSAGELARRARISDAVLLGAMLGMQILAAHAQISLLTGYLALAYGIWTLGGEKKQPAKRVIGLTILTLIVALGLAAGQLLPTLELLRDAERQRLSFAAVNRFYLFWEQLTNFVLPFRFGHPMSDNFIGPGNYWETCCYVGLLPFGLALVGGAAARKRQNGRFWLAVFVVGVWAALGGAGGLYRLFFWVLPGFRSFHDPARCLLWATVGLSVLAAFGWDALRKRLTPRVRIALAVIVIGFVFFDLARFDRMLYPLRPADSLFPISPVIAAVRADPEIQAGQARVLALDSGWGRHRFTNYGAFRRGVADFPTLWADTLTPNLGMPYGLPDAFGYEPLARRESQRISGTATALPLVRSASIRRQVSADWAGFLSVRAVIWPTDSRRPTSAPGWVSLLTRPSLTLPGKKNDESRVVLLKNARWQPRARVMTQFVLVPSQNDALSLLTATLKLPDSPDLSRTVIVTGRVSFASKPGPISPAGLIDDGPNRVVVNAENARPALLILADSNAPGWTATLDGRPAVILPANLALRAVPLESPGPHHIVFTYAPTAFRLGLYVSLLTLGALVGFWTARISLSRNQSEKRLSNPAGLQGRHDE